LQECLALVEQDPGAAAELALRWRDAAQGSAQSEPGQCLGLAQSRLAQWAEAEAAFVAARDISAASDRTIRARLGSMAGNAALAGGSAMRALAAFDTAHGEALAAGDPVLGGDIAIDRARALVALKRDDDAAAALTEARIASPANPLGWLLSATLSRRMGRLGEAQTQIEVAAGLLPTDPEIGLEAGVIAVLSGRDEAARKSWQSVIDASPQSDAALAAKTYLAQIAAP
jgi:tetratricopeptide (TPR) repeat protein